MSVIRPTPQDRIGAASITAVLVAALGYAFVFGLSVSLPGVSTNALQVFDVLPKPPPLEPEKTVADPIPSKKREGAAAPPNLKSKPTDLVVPPIVPIVPPPPLVVSRDPGSGVDTTAGGAAVPGPGPGSGGIGNGTGSGAQGNGDGGGGGTPPRQIAGRITNADYPQALARAHVQGTVTVLFAVAPSGRVTDCEIEKSSGNDQLDDTTCDLIIKRFRFTPSRDAQGKPVESVVESNQTWVTD